MFAGALDRWEAMQTTVEEPMQLLGGSGWLYGGVALCLLLSFYLVYRVFRRRASFRELEKTIEDLSLSDSAAAVLRDLADRYSDEAPGRAVRDAEVFERAVDRYVDAQDTPSPELCSMVTGLRKKLGFGRVKGCVLHSTRQLQRGDRIQLRPGEHSSGRTIESGVESAGEDVLTLRLPDDAKDLEPGQTVRATVLSNVGRYGFNTSVVGLDEEEHQCRLQHTVDLVQKDRRRYRRVSVRGPVRCRPASEPTEHWQEMELQDLSVCGARLLGANVLGDELSANSGDTSARRMEVQFRPADLLEDREEKKLERQITLTGRLVSKEKVKNGKFIYRIDLDEVSSYEKRVLARLVYLVETRDRR